MGCNSLLRKGGVLCRGLDDILEELDGIAAVKPKPTGKKGDAQPLAEPMIKPKTPPPIDPEQLKLWNLLETPVSIDELVEKSGTGVQHLSGILMLMEMNRVIRRLPGSRYERI